MIRLDLPLPMSVNRWPSHALELHRAATEYKRRCWLAAIAQARPLADPPARVVLLVEVSGRKLRDDDNAAGSLKWLIDALKQRQTGAVRWRRGLYAKRGFFVDDDPEHLELHVHQQRGPARCRVTITPRAVAGDDAAADAPVVARARDGRPGPEMVLAAAAADGRLAEVIASDPAALRMAFALADAVSARPADTRADGLSVRCTRPTENDPTRGSSR